MLTRTGERVPGAAPLATSDEIADAIASLRTARGSLDEDTLRHGLKERFRQRVEAFVTDPALDNAASYQRVRGMLTGLGESDKGNLTEVWYHRRYAKDAERHTPITVTRAGTDGDTWQEVRKIDLFDGKTATEVKSGAGPLGAEGKDQFLAYVDMAEVHQPAMFRGKPSPVEAVRYVFTDPAGARKNLAWMAEILRKREVEFIVEVFAETGQRLSLRSLSEIRRFLQGAP